MNVLDLFSGIGGFSLGLERAGMRTVAFCEIEPYCRAVLKKHWPNVPCYDDVRTLTADRLRADGIIPDVICGGFPCQDISVAGKGAGIQDGTRSGLWAEYARLIGDIRPRFVIVENVSALLSRGLDRVLGDLAAIRYDAEWHCIPASTVGAPHRRDRIWIMAYPAGERCGEARQHIRGCAERTAQRGEVLAHAQRQDKGRRGISRPGKGAGTDSGWSSGQPIGTSEALPNADITGLSQWHVGREPSPPRSRVFQGGELERAFATHGREQWHVEPNVGRVAHGIPSRVDRLRALGNAVVPQIPQIIGEAIMAMHRTDI